MRNNQKIYLTKVKYSSDQDFLKGVVNIPHSHMTSYDAYYVKSIALKKIKDQKFLSEFILTTRDQSLRSEAAKGISDPQLRKDILANIQSDEYLFLRYMDELVSDYDLTYRCLRKCLNVRVWEEVLPKIFNREVLKKLHESILSFETSGDQIQYRNCESILVKIEDRLEYLPPSIDFIVNE